MKIYLFLVNFINISNKYLFIFYAYQKVHIFSYLFNTLANYIM